MKGKPLGGGLRLTYLAVFFLAVIFTAGYAIAGDFTVQPDPSSMEADTIVTVNFTLANTDPSENITNITVAFPAGLEFVSGSDFVDNITSNTIDNTTANFSWGNTTAEGILNNGNSTYIKLGFYNMTAPGKYSFNISVWHTSGELNYSEPNITITDNTPPASITLNSPGNDTWTTAPTALINFSYTEFNPDSCIYQNSTANITNTTASSPCFVEITDYAEGTWSYTLWVNDTSGNIAQSQSYTLNYDATDPVGNSLGLYYQEENKSGGNITELGNVSIRVNVTDANSGINATLVGAVYANITNSSGDLMTIVNLTHASGNVFNGTWDADQYSAGGDNYSINITATDIAGNSKDSVISATLEIVGAPELYLEFSGWTSDNANPGWPTSNDNLTINVTVYNDGGDDFKGDVNVTLSRSGAGQIARASISNTSLEYGENHTLEFSVLSSNFSANGYHVFTAVVDPDLAVQESSESNNSATLGITLGYNISLYKFNEATYPSTGSAFPNSNVTVNISVTYANGSGVIGLDQGSFQVFNNWGANYENVTSRVYSLSHKGGGYYAFTFHTEDLYETLDGNRTSAEFGDNYLNVTAVSGSYYSRGLLLYNITAPNLVVTIDIEDTTYSGTDKNVGLNLTIENTGNAIAYGIDFDEDDNWAYYSFISYVSHDDLSAFDLDPGETFTYTYDDDDLLVRVVDSYEGSDSSLFVFIPYNDSVDNEYQGFDKDRFNAEETEEEEEEDEGSSAGGADTNVEFELSLTEWEDVIDAYPGRSNTTTVEVKNTGDLTAVVKVSLTCSIVDNVDVSPSSKSLAINERKEFLIGFDIEDDAEVGEYNCKVRAYVSTSEDDYDEEIIKIRVLATEEVAAEIEQEYQNISAQFNELFERFLLINPALVNDTNLTRVQNLLENANDTIRDILEAIEDGDYITANSLIESLQASILGTENALEELELEQTMGTGTAISGTWFWAVIIIVVVIAVGFIAYTFFPQKGYAPKKSILQRLDNTIRGGTSKISDITDSGKDKMASLKREQPAYGGYNRGVGNKLKGAVQKIKDKFRKKKPQKEVTQYFKSASSNIVNYE